MCGESWLAIKDSLTHLTSSQGWAPECPLGSIFIFCACVMCPGWDYLSFFPLCTSLASVLYTCISMCMYSILCTLESTV